MTIPEFNHSYLCTACMHREHDKCKVNCKYCPAICICGICNHSQDSCMGRCSTDPNSSDTPCPACPFDEVVEDVPAVP